MNSDLNEDSPQFTLTCISTGGPATAVIWTRDSTTTVTEGNVTVLDDPETAQYNHTLTSIGRWPEMYSCTVEDIVSSISATYNVQGVFFSFVYTVASHSTYLTYVAQGDFTGILLMWVPPSPLEDSTGYRISYNVVGGSSNSVNISDGNTSKYTLSSLEKGKDYNISIIGLSEHFFSVVAA